MRFVRKLKKSMQRDLKLLHKEKNLLTVLELALEMCERGFSFQKVDLYRSSANEFIIDGNSLIPPFNAIPGLGTNAAFNIVKAREEGEFLSKEDLQQRGKVSKTILEYSRSTRLSRIFTRSESVILVLESSFM